MNQNCRSTRLHIPKLRHSASRRDLKQQAKSHQYEQHRRYHHRPPVCRDKEQQTLGIL
ncbi:hypothetical protein LINGRAHAP2_LOCUS26819 [Linum grandiflorum]